MKYLAAIVLALGLSTPAMAQVTCAPIGSVTKVLKEKFGEVPQTTGISSRGSLVITFTNPSKGNWTLVIVGTDGNACLTATGADFEVIPQGDPA